MGIYYLIPSIKWKPFQFFPLTLMFVMDFQVCPLIVCATFCLYLSCWAFYGDKMLDFFSNNFSPSIEMTQLYFSFILLIREVYWFIYVGHPYILGRNPAWSLCRLTMCWRLWFGSTLMRSSASVFIRHTSLEVCFCAVSLSAFHIRAMLVSYNEFRNVPAFNFC